MKTLYVRLDSPPAPARADPWVLVDDEGRQLASGRDPPQRWPAADRRAAVLAADAVRVVALPLPPMPATRLAAATNYALEDRLAAPLDDAVVAVGPRRASEPVIAVVVGRALASGLAAAEPRFDRAIAEPQLAPAAQGWGWFESESGGFVREADGGAFAISKAVDPELPAELGAALRQAARAGTAPEQVVVHRTADERLIAAWTRAGGLPFAAGTPWQWTSATPAALNAAVDVLASIRQAQSPSVPRGRSPFATAIGLLIVAAVLHLGATAGTWAWNKIALARAERELASIARELGGSVPADIARIHGEARHRAGQSAPHDAMPLLARAAPALAALPPGTLRSAAYAQGAWTIELARLDDATLSALRARAASAGLSVVHAATQSGLRARITEAR